VEWYHPTVLSRQEKSSRKGWPLDGNHKTRLTQAGLLMEGLEPLMPPRLLTPTCALVTKDAATQHGAMQKSDACACNPARHRATRRGPATGPVALCTLPYISIPSPPSEDARSSRQSFATVFFELTCLPNLRRLVI
jgi:hypothetical protein